MILLYDTETTGFLRKTDLDDPSQPHITQLAMILFSGTGVELGSVNTLVRPDGWTIPEKLVELTGITNEEAFAKGIPEAHALRLFIQWLSLSKVLVAHNIEYDNNIMLIASARYKHDFSFSQQHFCTMKETTHLCQIPSTRGGYKWPKLQEAYRHFFGQEFEGAHNALNDLRATAQIYFEVQHKLNAFTCPACGGHFASSPSVEVKKCSDQFDVACTWQGHWPLI